MENAIYHGIKVKLAQGKISILAQLEGEDLVLKVQDNGVGMTEEQVNQLEEAFEGKRAPVSYGLHNVHQRIRLTYGNPYGLHVESCLQDGTTVTIRLPWKKRRRCSMYKLLICDDEAIIRNGLKSIIEKTSRDFDIIGLASNGFEAHEMILFEEPDLVLMDINMPGMTGLEIMENVQTQGIHSKFIIISGYDEFQYAQKAVKLRALDYILKPIDRKKLLQSLETALHDLIKEHHAKNEETLSADENLEKRALQLLYRNYGNSDFSLQSLADLLHISTSSLSRMLKKETGLSFSEYLTKIRMESSMCLLRNQKELSILEISERAGYKNQHYFCKVFRQYTGKTPSEYRHSTMM